MNVKSQTTKLKYQDRITELNLSDCPSSLAKERESEAFRFCYDDTEHPDTWITQAEKLGRSNQFPRANASDQKTCSDFAISFFTTEDYARGMWKSFAPRAKEILGFKKLMTGTVLKDDGLCTPEESHGHFNLFEYENCNFDGRFQVVTLL